MIRIGGGHTQNFRNEMRDALSDGDWWTVDELAYDFDCGNEPVKRALRTIHMGDETEKQGFAYRIVGEPKMEAWVGIYAARHWVMAQTDLFFCGDMAEGLSVGMATARHYVKVLIGEGMMRNTQRTGGNGSIIYERVVSLVLLS